MAYKEGIVIGTVNLNATGSATTAIGATSNSGTINIGNTSSGAIAIDCGTAGITIGTTANAHATTVGSTTGASSLALRTGTADFTLASATGTIMSALDTGEITYPLQSAFLAYNSADDVNVTGAGTAYTVICNTEVYDQSADYNNASGTFTAPITGRYHFSMVIRVEGMSAAMTSGTMSLITSNRSYSLNNMQTNAGGQISWVASTYADMDLGDTATITITVFGGAGDTADVSGDVSVVITLFGGKLVC